MDIKLTIHFKRFFTLHKMLVLYGSILAVGMFGLFFGLIPTVKQTLTVFSDVRVLQAGNKKLEAKISLLSSLSLTDLERQSTTTLMALPADKSVATLLSSVDTLAANHNLTIPTMTIEGISSVSTASAKPVMTPLGIVITETLSLQGSLADFRDFLSESVKVRRLMRVHDFKLTGVPQSNKITARLAIDMYYLPLPATIGKPMDALLPLNAKELKTLTTIDSYPILFQKTDMARGEGSTPTTPALADPFAVTKSISPIGEASPTQTPSLSPTVTPRSGTPSATPRVTLTLTPTPVTSISPTPPSPTSEL